MLGAALFFLFALGLFGFLALWTPCNPSQHPFVPRGFWVDLGYIGISLTLYQHLIALLTRMAADVAYAGQGVAALAEIKAGRGMLSGLPLILQCVIALLVSDLCQYWLHRAFHGRRLWAFHAVHHSAQDVHWSTAYRIHPLNFAFYTGLTAAVVMVLGFSPAALASVALINTLHSMLVHANLNWTFGPLKALLASPVFHRWHHSSATAAQGKNFASTFSFIDILFGTYFMPEGELPTEYGAAGVPKRLAPQLLHPFRRHRA